MTLRRTVLGSGLLGLVVLLLLAAAAVADPGDPHKRVVLSASDAGSALAEFAPTQQLSVSGPFEGKNQRYYRVDGKDVLATVDAFDGTVRTLTLLSNFPADAKVAVDEFTARSAAEAFIEDHRYVHPDVEPQLSLLDHGTFKEYLVEWQSRVNGALVPDYMSVSVNPVTGGVFGHTNFARSYVTPPTASVDQGSAEEIANKQMDATARWTTRSAELSVDFDDDGSQTLIWTVVLVEPGGSVVAVQVNAESGAALIIARG